MTERNVPAGFVVKPVETEVSGVTYTTEVLQAESLAAILAVYKAEQPDKNPEEIIRDIWNSGNEQGAKQSPKSAVRKAIDEHGKGEMVDEPALDDDGEPIFQVDEDGNPVVDEDGNPVPATVTRRELPDEVTEAIATAIETGRTFIQGAPRGGGGTRHESGLTAKQREALGSAIALDLARGVKLTDKRKKEIAEEIGIPLDLLTGL